MRLKVEGTTVFEKNWEAFQQPDVRYIINQGGSRSSKSYSILQCLILKSLISKVTISIVRQSFPALRGSIMKDFFEILMDLKLYEESRHSKTEHTYTFKNGSVIEFFSTDSEQKIRGRKRDILYCNEANELSFDVFLQLKIRTTDKILMDFNPSDDDHYIYDIIEEPTSILIKSTYLDNPKLGEQQIRDIEGLINADENYYRVYVLGERGISGSRIYSHFKQFIDEIQTTDVCYGLDLGYNDPIALVETRFVGNKVYVYEHIYESKLTTQDLIERLKILNISKSIPIYCDHRPEVIEEIKREGFNIKSAYKNILQGISLIKSKEIYVHHEAINLLKEVKIYSFKTKGSKVLDEVVDLNNHMCDALRYAIHTHKGRNTPNRPSMYVFDV